MMSDPNIEDFRTRLARIERARARGLGFEAAGTLGRSAARSKRKRHRNLLAPLLLVTLCIFGTKGLLHAVTGAGRYETRVEALRQGEGFDRLGGLLMQADPLTLWVSDRILRLKGRLG